KTPMGVARPNYRQIEPGQGWQNHDDDHAGKELMTAHADILDQPEPLKGYFAASVAVHAFVLGGAAIATWIVGNRPQFGAPDAGGVAVGIVAVKSIPLAHQGEPNPVANDSKSEVPQQPEPVKRERVKREAPPKDAIPIKGKPPKPQPLASVQRFKSFS